MCCKINRGPTCSVVHRTKLIFSIENEPFGPAADPSAYFPIENGPLGQSDHRISMTRKLRCKVHFMRLCSYQQMLSVRQCGCIHQLCISPSSKMNV